MVETGGLQGLIPSQGEEWKEFRTKVGQKKFEAYLLLNIFKRFVYNSYVGQIYISSQFFKKKKYYQIFGIIRKKKKKSDEHSRL